MAREAQKLAYRATYLTDKNMERDKGKGNIERNNSSSQIKLPKESHSQIDVRLYS